MNKKRRKIEYYNVSNETINSLLDIGNTNDIDIEEYEGSLLDNYIMHNNNLISLGANKTTRLYIIINERYLNEWSSSYSIIMTDDVKLVEEYRNIFAS